MTKLIERNTTIPTRKGQIFSTASDNQTSVEINALQGERDMASDNRSLGRFSLVDIPPAPRGVPQIEVTFDIDANGIVSVFAKDLGTGKEQKIVITSETKLSENDINRMVKEGEEHKEDDKKRKETIEVRNNLDSLVYQAEKLIRENGEKVPKDLKGELEAAISTVKTKLSSEDLKVLKDAKTEFEAKVHKLTESIYKQAGAEGAGAGQASGSNPNAKAEDNVVDAEYEDNPDSKKK